ncbi:MAG TPA: hypothetical protein VE177_04575, partial [Candidatus Binatus sp.]|nr:hypothetical protein [Candidatus Binatus sp.]
GLVVIISVKMLNPAKSAKVIRVFFSFLALIPSLPIVIVPTRLHRGRELVIRAESIHPAQIGPA